MSASPGARRRTAAVAAVLLVLGGAAACGEQSSSAASGDGTSYDEADLLDGLREAAEEQGTVRGTVEADGAMIEGSVVVGADPPEADATMTVTIDEENPWSIHVVQHDGWVYLRGPDQQRYWKMAPDDERLTGAAALMHEDIDPVEALDRMAAGLVGVEHLGAGEVEGEPAEQYQVTVDHTGEHATASGLGTVAEGVVYDVWVDAEGLLRRFVWSTPRGNQVTHDFSDWGEPVDIAPPPADQLEAG